MASIPAKSVIEFFMKWKKKKKKDKSNAEISDFLAKESGCHPKEVDFSVARGQLRRLYARYVDSKKAHEKEEIKSEQFVVPLLSNTSGKSKLSKSPKSFDLDVSFELASELVEVTAKAKVVEDKLKKVTNNLKDRRKCVKSMQGKLQSTKRSVATAKKRIVSANVTKELEKVKTKVTNLTEEIEKLKSTLDERNSEVKILKKTIKELERKNTQLKKAHSGLQSWTDTERVELQAKVKTLQDAKSALEANEQYLRDIVNDNDGETVNLFDEDKNRFTDLTMEVAMNLDSLNVANANIGPVMKESLKLAGKKPNRTPCPTTVANFIVSKGIIARKHVAQVVPELEHTTVYTDESPKFGKVYNVFAVTDKDHTPYLLGLREMSNKSAQTTLDTFKEILSDMSKIGEFSDAGFKILSNITNTMSDRAATEKKFNELLQAYRETILPDVVKNWAELNDEERENLSRMNNFYCGLHLLVHFSEVSAKALMGHEELTTDAEQVHSEVTTCDKGSNTIGLLIRASKCFASGVDEQSGCHGLFKTFCEKKKERVKFVGFRGNRFNIVFVIAQIVHYHKHRILEFFATLGGKDMNKLRRCTYSDMKNPTLMAGCKVLGLVSKLITAPLWRLIEDCTNIIDMNEHYARLLDYLNKMSMDAAPFLAGTESPFPDMVVYDEVHTSLLVEDEFDDTAILMAQAVCRAMKLVLERMVADHLPGGKYCTSGATSAEFRESTGSVVAHNKLREFVFGQLGFMLTYRPNASLLVNETFIMYNLNCTKDWLESLSEAEHDEILADARKRRAAFKQEYRERCDAIKKERHEAMRLKQEAAAKKAQQELKRREQFTDDITPFGLWHSVAQADEMYQALSDEKDKLKALKAQLNFRKHVLLQKSKDKDVFHVGKTVDGTYRKHNSAFLLTNLYKLL